MPSPLGTSSSAQPEVPESADDDPPPEPDTDDGDDEDGWAQQGLSEPENDEQAPEPMLDDADEQVHGAPANAGLPEPTTDDEDEEASLDWENMSYSAQHETSCGLSQMRSGTMPPPSPPKVVGGYAGDTPERSGAAGNDNFYSLASLLRPPRPLKPQEARQLLRAYGYRGINKDCKFSDPMLSITLAQHFERAGHTWYELKCSLRPNSTVSGWTNAIVWTVHRRLAMLRKDLHDHVKSTTGKIAYVETFQDNRFPSRGGLPGTSAKLKKWLATMSEWVNCGKAPAMSIAHVLKFLEIPPVDGSLIKAADSGTGDPRSYLPKVVEGQEDEAAQRQLTAFMFETELTPRALSKKLFPDEEQESDDDQLRM